MKDREYIAINLWIILGTIAVGPAIYMASRIDPLYAAAILGCQFLFLMFLTAIRLTVHFHYQQVTES